MKPPLQVFTEIRELFKDRKNWTSGAWARDKDGRECDINDRRACRWCLSAAIELKAGDQSAAVKNVLYELMPGSIVGKNDDEGYDAVMALLDKAIAHVQK